MNATVRSSLQAATSALNGAKSHGPKTREGKTRSSLNALRHGLSASNLLLPGEDAAEYEQHLDGYFSSFAPTTLPEAHVVVQVADLAWKLKRLSKMEDGRVLALLEEALEGTDAFQLVTSTRRALEALSSLVAAVDARPTAPKEPEMTEALLRGLEGTLVLLREVPGLPEAVLQPLSLALQEARDTSKEGPLEQSAYEHLGNMAKLARGALAAKLAQEEAALVPVRERLAAEVLLLEDADLKKLERHRKLLESSMQRQLDLLGQMRLQMAASKPEAQAEAQELRLRLRVVK
ncbi:hypothetical protein [Myxococcus sp. CA040A]|uniref:hypothetical protein n=1 Tax=Myxococcus sp. CA040A TaxID=2741738 RepID=UPI00157AF072|nr:hypothetical protein [Myxococcus sp. CA040A]NTX08009.1 hypothetical protein [Myxococcus sp. CA040A]